MKIPRMLCLFGLLLLFMPLVALFAQVQPAQGDARGADTVSGPWDVFLGGSALRRDGVNNYGFTLQVAEYPYKGCPWLGGMVDFSAHYGDYGPVSLATYSTMAGVSVAHRSGRLQPFGHFLAGATETYSSAVYSGTTLTGTVNNFAYQAGGGADLHLGRHWGLRAQADWFTLKINSQMDFLYRASGGIKFDF